MLAGLCPVYVDRFARVWHRLSTTDPYTIMVIITLWGKERKYNFRGCGNICHFLNALRFYAVFSKFLFTKG